MDKNIETLVKLKYPPANSRDEFYKAVHLYPVKVLEETQKRWRISNNDYSAISESYKWTLWLKWLFEELCKYENEMQNE